MPECVGAKKSEVLLCCPGSSCLTRLSRSSPFAGCQGHLFWVSKCDWSFSPNSWQWKAYRISYYAHAFSVDGKWIFDLHASMNSDIMVRRLELTVSPLNELQQRHHDLTGSTKRLPCPLTRSCTKRNAAYKCQTFQEISGPEFTGSDVGGRWTWRTARDWVKTERY